MDERDTDSDPPVLESESEESESEESDEVNRWSLDDFNEEQINKFILQYLDELQYFDEFILQYFDELINTAVRLAPHQTGRNLIRNVQEF